MQVTKSNLVEDLSKKNEHPVSSESLINNDKKILNELPFTKPNNKKLIFAFSFLAIFLGLISGWAVSGIIDEVGKSPVQETDKDNVATSENITEDEFPLIGEGVLQDGGVNGDGTHTLKRDSESDVILLSTVISLDSFIGNRIQVWGKTLTATSDEAGWLVDVTKVKVLE